MHRLPLWWRAAVWPMAAIVRLWSMTLRMAIPAEDLRNISLQGEPIIFVLWHNRLFIAPEMVRRYRGGHPLFGLVSASRDGAWMSAFLSCGGVSAVRGSSSRLGREAATALVEELRAGNDVAISPDGPRGPVYEMKPGALIVARRARTLVMLVGIDFESSWRLPSWDGFHMPKPFSRVHVRCVAVEARALDDRDEAARRLGGRLAEINPDRRPAPVRRRA
ncbi:MAG TPA: DUF374 domain-containing protein [Opitutaceae bacterium]|nr:DUF374 domain-containing protein [Opitutaceae bacterium]